MPPRIPSSRCQPQQLLHLFEASAPSYSSSLSPSAALATHTLGSSQSAAPSPRCRSSSTISNNRRAFSTTPPRPRTRLRREFLKWLETKGRQFREPPARGPVYVGQASPRFGTTLGDNQLTGDMPFPENPAFRSQPVLSEKARELIWQAVMREGLPLKAVSARYSVDMRRVAAVVRMKEIEKRWERENKPLADPYARAVQKMLPTHNLSENKFEPINDIHVHSYTTQQLFVPTSESREFTRADAAKAFGEHILPPDAKMRIPELIGYEKNLAEGMDYRLARRVLVQEAAESEAALAKRQKARLDAAEERRVRVDSGRFEFRFEKINAEDVGPTGRSRRGVGWRYGVPLYDRRRGEVKIPTKVE